MSKIDALEKKIGLANSKLDSKLVEINSTMRENFDTLPSAFVDADLEGQLKEMTVQTMSTLAYINSSITNYDMELNKSVNQFQSNLQSMDARVNQNLVSLENRVSESRLVSLPSQLVTLNSTMKDYFRSVSNELNHVNETILGKMNTLYSKFDLLNGTVSDNCSVIKSDLISVDSRLDTMNELLRADFNEVKSELSAVSEKALAVGDRLESRIMTAQGSLTERIGDYICGGTGGWRRVVYLNMTDPSTNCPSSWYLIQNPKRVCFTGTSGCTSEFFPVNGGPYNQVCGRIRAYQRGQADALFGYIRNGQTTIDSAYFSGVAVMHGNPREHIWTFVAGAYENYTHTERMCPCDAISDYSTVPPFLGGDYFCESGYIWPGYWNRERYRLHYNDTLWDGKDCHSTSKCCSRHNPPYFTKTLSQHTSVNLELRMCRQNYLALEMVEIYVKQDYVITKLEEIDNKLNVRQSSNIDNLSVHTCGGSGGWRRAVYMDMTDPSTNCPSGWNITGYSKRSCGRANSSELSCDSVFFPVNGGPYSQVCGRMRAYQKGIVHSFSGFSRSGQTTIDSAYFSGVAVMHGSPRQHVWTFAVGLWENGT